MPPLSASEKEELMSSSGMKDALIICTGVYRDTDFLFQGNIKIDGRKVSDTESTDTFETIPVASDWVRMISWATYPADVSTPLQGSMDDIKTMKQSKFLPWEAKKHKPSIPKWRCFVKSMASTHCVLTFIPASFHDLKLLMLGNDAKMYKLYDSAEKKLMNLHNYEEKSFPETVLHTTETETSRPESVIDSGCTDSIYSKSSKIELNEDDLVFDSVSSKTNILKDKLEQPFRLRSSSWDPMKRKTEPCKFDSRRIRTSSVGSKMKPVGIQKALIEHEELIKSSVPTEKIKPFYGAITLPIYIYDCPLSNLVDALIFKSSFERRPDIFQDKSSKSELDHFLNKSDSENTPDDLDLRHHCRVITQAFNKSFVDAMFKSLHSNHKMFSIDIQTAVDECEETLLEINITKYIQTVCGHFKSLLNDSNNEDVLHINAPTCLLKELIPLHKLIKQRFQEILSVCFKSISTSPEYFFCAPPVADIGIDLSTTRTENQDFDLMTIQSDVVDFSSNHNSLIGGWDRNAYEATQDDARTSLLSNMDSDSVTDYLNDVSDELFPLFLHLLCSVRLSNNTKEITKPVKIIPTCLCELLEEIKDFKPSELINATITLDMHCLTLPPAYPADLPAGDLTSHQLQDVIAGAIVHTEPLQTSDQHFTGDSLKINEKLHHLPQQQNQAINRCINEIEWFLQDEIAVFLLDSVPITESTLTYIANHVTSSDGNHNSCVLDNVPLDFVFGPEHSLERFILEFAQIKIPGYCLKRENDYYYLIKSKTSCLEMFEEKNNHIIENSLGDHKKYSNSSKNLNEIRNTDWADIDCKAFYVNLTYRWIQDLNQCRNAMPNFWLILKIDDEKVTCFFHCRFLEIDSEEVQYYKNVHQQILGKVEHVCKIVNQTLLLNSLHETKMCDSLLEPETGDDLWKPSQTFSFSKPVDDIVDIDFRGNHTGVNQKFHPGSFSCPVVWENRFALHPRLKTGPGKPGLSRAIQALRTVLNRFSVNNRTNMFVYQDSNGSNVFYLRLHENIRNPTKISGAEDENSPNSVSRSSSINSLTNKKFDESTAKEYRPRLKSFGESFDNLISRQEDSLTLRVHGISPAGAEVKNELVQVLQNRLDDAVLEVVSVMLARNPMCKLSPADVQFIQKPNHAADLIMKFTIPKYAQFSLNALTFYIKQNLQQFIFLPKYIDSRIQFQDYSQPEGSPKRIGENNIYLYNQTQVSGNKGISCLAISLVDSKGNIIQEGEFINPVDVSSNYYEFEPNVFHKLTHSELCTSSNMDDSNDVLMEVRLWKQGRFNKEVLIQKLKGIIQFSLWDLLTESHLLNTPLKEKLLDSNSPDKKEIMNNIYYRVIPEWLHYGHELNVPAVKTHKIKLPTRHAVSIILKEINSLVQIYEQVTHIFYENNERTEAVVYNGGYDIPSHAKCFLISSNASIYTNFLETDYHQTLDNSTKRPVHEGNGQISPRHKFLISLISNKQVVVYMYNWTKEKSENLSKLLTQLGQWLSARSNFLIGIITQKMGLFHNQPFARKPTPQLFCNDGAELDSLLSFTPASTPRKMPTANMSSMTYILRDSDSVVVKKSCADPVVASVHQVNQIKSKDRREQHEKLNVMWQSRGVTPYVPLSEDTLELFLTYSRSIHYCLTPLLFHPKWRLESAATRDNSLLASSNSLQLFGFSTNLDFDWHHRICCNFINEYKQYLQTLGYIPVQTAPNTPRKIGRFMKSDDESKCYLQKSLLGGIVMLEISLIDPFFQVKLDAIEYSRLQAKPGTNLLPQILLNFLEECDKVKMLIHLHSFTYDFHLKCLQSYIKGEHSPLIQDYHLISFLEDFLKYYPKAPNFARNLASCEFLGISNLLTPPLQLFNYLLSHEKDYDMEVLRMLPQEKNRNDSDFSSKENEFILVKQDRTSYKDDFDNKQAYDFIVTSIIAYDKNSTRSNIKLNFYILLTSGKELYPKAESESKLGQFFTVSTANPLGFIKATSALDPTNEFHQTELNFGAIDPLLIRQESVNYLGYYSSHEQLMQRIMSEESEKVNEHIKLMVNRGSVDCRIHLLWNKLLSNPSSMNSLSYCELFELRGLAHIQKLVDLDSCLIPILTQPISWYQGLMKILMAKYSDKYKLFSSPDNATQHLLILHPRFSDGFVMLTIDTTMNTGELYTVFRHPYENDVTAEDIHNLIEGVVNACCYHLWLTIIS